MRKHPVVQMLAIGVVASIIGIAIVLHIDWFPTSADTAAHKIDTLYDVLLICSVPVFVLVMTVAIYSVVKFRAKPGDMSDGAPIHGNTRLEIIWVTIPFLMVTGLAIYGWVVLNDVEAKKPNERTINVVGQQFTWHFQYAKNGATPTGACGGTASQVTLPLRRQPAGLLPDLREGRDPLVLGARVPAQGGRGAGHRPPTSGSRPTASATTRWYARSSAASATRPCACPCTWCPAAVRRLARGSRRAPPAAAPRRRRRGRRHQRRGQGTVHRERLQQLPHAGRRERDRHRRPEPQQSGGQRETASSSASTPSVRTRMPRSPTGFPKGVMPADFGQSLTASSWTPWSSTF